MGLFLDSYKPSTFLSDILSDLHITTLCVIYIYICSNFYLLTFYRTSDVWFYSVKYSGFLYDVLSGLLSAIYSNMLHIFSRKACCQRWNHQMFIYYCLFGIKVVVSRCQPTYFKEVCVVTKARLTKKQKTKESKTTKNKQDNQTKQCFGNYLDRVFSRFFWYLGLSQINLD